MSATPRQLVDAHAGLCGARVASVERPTTEAEIVAAVRLERERRAAGPSPGLSVGGALHSMGGQAFGAGTRHLDMTRMTGVVAFDRDRGLITLRSGTRWPEVIEATAGSAWAIRQKQTGADGLTVGGSVSVNAHGRGLAMPPIVADTERLRLVTPDGEVVDASRTQNTGLFRHAVGGYGLFGVLTEVTLRLARRRVLRRRVRLADRDEAVGALERARDGGHLYGDFQFDIDHEGDGFLRRGVLSTYEPADDAGPPPKGQRRLTHERWLELVRLARSDKARAFDLYAGHYLATDGQVYRSDAHQLSAYVEGYAERIDALLPEALRGTEIITELYVPRARAAELLERAAVELRARRSPATYGTLRLIEPDRETALPWAREAWACVIFNLFARRDTEDRGRAGEAFCALIDHALELGGTFFLTYHRFATGDQLRAGHPGLEAFMAERRRRDPGGVLRSDWAEAIERTLATPGVTGGRRARGDAACSAARPR